MEALLDNPDFGVNFIEGGWQYTYKPNGEFFAKFTDFLFNYTIVTDDAFGNPIFTDAELSVDGEGSAFYYVSGDGLLVTHSVSDSSVSFSQKIWMNGDLISESNLNEGGMFNPSNAGASEYTCTPTTLSIRTAPLDLPQNTPVDYDKVDN